MFYFVATVTPKAPLSQLNPHISESPGNLSSNYLSIYKKKLLHLFSEFNIDPLYWDLLYVYDQVYVAICKPVSLFLI